MDRAERMRILGELVTAREEGSKAVERRKGLHGELQTIVNQAANGRMSEHLADQSCRIIREMEAAHREAEFLRAEAVRWQAQLDEESR